MLDFSRLRVPASHGDVLVEPCAADWLGMARENHESLSRASATILGSPLSHWRRRTREEVVGRDDALVFVLGHQPELFHSGVWAKRVVAARVAATAEGVALNLVVDNDAPHQTGLAVPATVGGRVTLRHVTIPGLASARPHEYTPRMSGEVIANFEQTIREAMGERFRDSQVHAFIRGMAGRRDATDWVDQILAGTAAVDSQFGISVLHRRVSRLASGPLLADMLLNAGRFAESYNAALAAYRRAYRVRGDQRPIPDLHVSPDRCEVPVWATRADEPRRRLFVNRVGSSLVLRAGQTPIGELSVDSLADPGAWATVLGKLNGWNLRPRALALTIWARLLLADLFIHGIGGAKYDRISDTIMADYYGVTPPHMVCVSATLHLDLPHREVSAARVRSKRWAVRDLTYNPQRHLTLGAELAPLIDQRSEAIRVTEALRSGAHTDRAARRAAFDKIRRTNQELLDANAGEVERRRTELLQTMQQFEQGRIARGREYFFGLYDDKAIGTMLAALPSERDFRV